MAKLMNKLKNSLQKRRELSKNENGFSIVDMVISIALTTTISGVLVFAVIALNSVQKDTLENANASMAASGMMNYFANEVEESKAHKIDEEHGTLTLLTSDDLCATYRYNADKQELSKNITEPPSGSLVRHSVIGDEIESVTFEEAETSHGVTVTVVPKRGKTSVIEAEPKVLQGASGGCW